MFLYYIKTIKKIFLLANFLLLVKILKVELLEDLCLYKILEKFQKP